MDRLNGQLGAASLHLPPTRSTNWRFFPCPTLSFHRRVELARNRSGGGRIGASSQRCGTAPLAERIAGHREFAGLRASGRPAGCSQRRRPPLRGRDSEAILDVPLAERRPCCPVVAAVPGVPVA
ncbi:hypothetical protein BS78_K193300 [Paspalum vaginatum]|uniref:Uncharacterized protein n=1 Tax=Paspalum vaginatum TaxID=158149 RepID=A0A9W7XAG9_9POAL|nr:hypothetical protein BS78_K193300 [Paspalum vaginatum]